MGRADKLEIPQRREELTTQWFTSVIAPPSRVVDVAVTSVGAGLGFMGELYRCQLTWGADAGGGLPSSVIVKLPSTNPENRSLGEALRAYEREIEVYRTLGQDLGIPMPRMHHSAMDPDPAPWLERPIVWLLDTLSIGGVNRLLTGFVKLSGKSRRRYVLVIEDIGDARPPTQVDGGTLVDAEAALIVLARFHAANWMRRQATLTTGSIWPINRTPKAFQASYRRNRAAFVERWGTSLGGRAVAWLDDIDKRLAQISDELLAEPWTLLHGDYRLDNILFRTEGEIVVLDFQGVSYGRPGFDVAYFITTALDPEHKSAEMDLLRTYHRALVDAGVTSYSWDELVADCQLTKGLLAHRFVCGRDMLDTEFEGSDESLVDLMTTRAMGWFDPEEHT